MANMIFDDDDAENVSEAVREITALSTLYCKECDIIKLVSNNKCQLPVTHTSFHKHAYRVPWE